MITSVLMLCFGNIRAVLGIMKSGTVFFKNIIFNHCDFCDSVSVTF